MLKLPVFGPSRRCDGATTASADFCRSITAPRDAVSPVSRNQPRSVTSKAARLKGIRRVGFLVPSGPDRFGLRVFWPSRPPDGRLLCASCSSGRSFACPLPSHAASQQRGCGSAGDTRDQGSQRTYTSKSSRHARRKKESVRLELIEAHAPAHLHQTPFAAKPRLGRFSSPCRLAPDTLRPGGTTRVG